jgi:hypothetical protein
LDNDDDYDLIIGADILDFVGFMGSYLIFWRNIGTTQVANFLQEDTIYISDYPPEFGSPRPFLSDIDNDGDLDMFVGESGGAMLFYRNMEMENAMATVITVSVSGNDIILNWQAVAEAEQYHIYYQNTPYFTPSGIPQAVVVPPDTVWTDVNALMQGKRWYRVVVEY